MCEVTIIKSGGNILHIHMWHYGYVYRIAYFSHLNSANFFWDKSISSVELKLNKERIKVHEQFLIKDKNYWDKSVESKSHTERASYIFMKVKT